MVNQRIPERDVLKELANLYPAFTSVEDVDLKPQAKSYPPALRRPTMREVVEGFLALRRHQRVKPGTLDTEGKRLAQFERAMAMAGFDHLPADLPPVMDYLGRFNGESGRHRRNQQDILGMLYRYAHRQFGLPNPMAGLPESPQNRLGSCPWTR